MSLFRCVIRQSKLFAGAICYQATKVLSVRQQVTAQDRPFCWLPGGSHALKGILVVCSFQRDKPVSTGMINPGTSNLAGYRSTFQAGLAVSTLQKCIPQRLCRPSSIPHHTFTAGHHHKLQVAWSRQTVRTFAAKTKAVYVCKECGHRELAYYGKCFSCRAMGSFEKVVEEEEPRAMGGAGNRAAALARQKAFEQMGPDDGPFLSYGSQLDAPTVKKRRSGWVGHGTDEEPQSLRRLLRRGGGEVAKIQLPGDTGQEICRVLGDGVMPGSVVLVGGDPGVGKSTMMVQLAAMLVDPQARPGSAPASGGLPRTVVLKHQPVPTASGREGAARAEDNEEEGDEDGEEKEEEGEEEGEEDSVDAILPGCVLYFTGEESVQQVASRALRLGIGECTGLFFVSATSMDHICHQISQYRPKAVVVDSIQTMYLSELPGSAGSTTQVKECAAALTRIAKSPGGPVVFLVGHVTKEGDIAGPKALEHIVDTVLSLEGEERNELRILRGQKNRFGQTDDIGIFAMKSHGLEVVKNPSAIFNPDGSAGQPQCAAVGCFLEGDTVRPIIVEVQALCIPMGQNSQGPPTRVVNGMASWNRLTQLLGIMQKNTPIRKLYQCALYINVVHGLKLSETASDLTVALAVTSSYLEKPIPRDICAFGEVDLLGKLRFVHHIDKRLKECAKMGFRQVIIPADCNVDMKQWKGLQVKRCATLKDAMEAVFGKINPPSEGSGTQ